MVKLFLNFQISKIIFKFFQGEMWSILIEKAYAKAYGGYHNIGMGGTGDYAFFDLTGAPSESINFAYISVLSGKMRKAKKRKHKTDSLEPQDLSEMETNHLFDKIYEYDQKGFIMACGTRDFNNDEERTYQKRLEEYKNNKQKGQKSMATVEREFGNGLYTTHA